MDDIQYVYQQADTETKQSNFLLAEKYQDRKAGQISSTQAPDNIYADLLNPKYPIAPSINME